MATRASTGLLNKLLATNPFKTIFALGFIDVYSGTQPTSANDAATGTKLCTLYSDGTATGLSFAAAATGGAITKLLSETWSGTILADGVAGYYRLREAGDAGTSSSTTAARLDGAIGTSGAELNMGSLVFTAGAPFILPTASFSIPASA